MLRLLWILASCFWCVLLLRHQAVADEEALWGPTPSRERPPESKQSSSWWPKFPSLPFRIPFYGRSDSNPEADDALTTTTAGLTESAHHSQDHLGSGEGSISDASEPPTTLTQGLLASVAKTGPEPLPTGTSDSPHSSTTQSNNDGLVSDSYSHTSSSIRNTLFTNSPTSTSTPEQNATHTRPPGGTERAAGPSMGTTPQHLPEELTDKKEAGDFTEKMYSTIPPETTVPTALTWAAAQPTTAVPQLVDTPPATVAPHKSSETTFDRQPQYSTVSAALHTGDSTVTETHPTQSKSGQGVTEVRSGPVEEEPGVIPTAMGTDHKLEPITTSTTPSRRVNVPIVGGKKRYANQ